MLLGGKIRSVVRISKGAKNEGAKILKGAKFLKGANNTQNQTNYDQNKIQNEKVQILINLGANSTKINARNNLQLFS